MYKGFKREFMKFADEEGNILYKHRDFNLDKSGCVGFVNLKQVGDIEDEEPKREVTEKVLSGGRVSVKDNKTGLLFEFEDDKEKEKFFDLWDKTEVEE